MARLGPGQHLTLIGNRELRMGLDVRMPKMGESLAEGTLVKWYKRVGDAVRRDEPLFEISTTLLLI